MLIIRVFLLISLSTMSELMACANASANETMDKLSSDAIGQAETQPHSPAKFTPAMTLSAQDTHSGLKLPRWVSLKHNNINGRKGPGKNFTHLWTFRRQGMPVIVINEMDNWRKIRDIEGGESWVRSVALSGQSMGIITTVTPLLKKPNTDGFILANLSPNVLLKIKTCSEHYCAVEIDPELKAGQKKGPKGYVERRAIWGVEQF